ncbi:MAG: hypothetical protein A2W75_03805 [Nitrospinae bacterium RIFCSPLOWO2_12_39_15]|nr:MAG: hypothetical protein A2W75_03805 [Nitrospinae bacterium RIFCSPLOWO2_12_39_15]
MDDEKYTIEKSLETLEIKYDDITQVSDGSYGYLFLLVSNIDEADEEKLQVLGFIKMFDDLWYKEGEDLRDIPKTRLIEIVENLCGKESKQRESVFREENIRLWQSIVYKLCNILEKNNSLITVRDLDTACKFNGFLCKNKEHLTDFLSRLNEFLKHVILDEKFRENIGHLKRYKVLRDYYIHDLGKDPKSGSEKIAEVQSIHESIISKSFPNNQYDFMTLHKNILEDCDNALERIIDFLNRS